MKEFCDIIKCLQPGMSVMADRGFKHVELYLLLLRPPSIVIGPMFNHIYPNNILYVLELVAKLKLVPLLTNKELI